MKRLSFVCLCTLFLAAGCQEEKRFTVKVINTKNGSYEWYYYSLITNYSPDRIDFVDENCERILIYEGHNVMNVDFEESKLVIECFDCDTIELNLLKNNQIKIIENKNSREAYDAIRKRDSLARILKTIRCR
jgi:hypothetical protein